MTMEDILLLQNTIAFEVIISVSAELMHGARPHRMHESFAKYFDARANLAEKQGIEDSAKDWRERAARHRMAAEKAEGRE